MEDFEALRELLQPDDASQMRHNPVSARVNSVQNEDPECDAPVVLESPAQAELF